MKNYSDEINIILNSFLCELKKLRDVIEKFNNYVCTFNNASAFVVALTTQQQNEIKTSICNLSLKISTFKFEEITEEVVQLMDELLQQCTAPHPQEVDINLVCLEEYLKIYSQSYSKNVCDYLEYINHIKTINTNELIKKGISLIHVIDNNIKKIAVLLT